MLAPPFIVTEEEIEELLSRFKLALEKTAAALAPQGRTK